VLEETLEATQDDYKVLTILQQEWLLLYQKVQTQRYGYGLCLAPIIHSELWIALKERGWKGDAKLRAFDNVTRLDNLYVEIANEEQAKKKQTKEVAPEEGLKKVINQQAKKG